MIRTADKSAKPSATADLIPSTTDASNKFTLNKE